MGLFFKNNQRYNSVKTQKIWAIKKICSGNISNYLWGLFTGLYEDITKSSCVRKISSGKKSIRVTKDLFKL